jgi:hypothetical protein
MCDVFKVNTLPENAYYNDKTEGNKAVFAFFSILKEPNWGPFAYNIKFEFLRNIFWTLTTEKCAKDNEEIDQKQV